MLIICAWLAADSASLALLSASVAVVLSNGMRVMVTASPRAVSIPAAVDTIFSMAAIWSSFTAVSSMSTATLRRLMVPGTFTVCETVRSRE